MADKNYIGRGKEIGQYGIIAINICLSDIPETEISEFKGKKYVRLAVGKTRTPDDKGRTHTVWVDDWKPDPSKRRDGSQTSQNAPQSEDGTDDQINPEDIPF